MEKAKSFITDIGQKSPKFFQILLLFLITEAGIFVSFFIFKSSFNLEMLSDWFYVLEDLSYFLVLIFYILAYFKGVLNVWKGINWEHTFFEGIMLVMLGFAFILLAMSLVLTPLDIGSASLQNSLVLSIGLFGGYAFFLNLCFDEKEEKIH